MFQLTGAGNESANGYYAIDPGHPTHDGRQQWRKMKEDGSFYSTSEQEEAEVYSTYNKRWFICTGTSGVIYVTVVGTPLPPTDGWTHPKWGGTGPCPQLKWLSKSVCW